MEEVKLMMMIVVRYKGRWKWDGFVGLNLWKKLTMETNKIRTRLENKTSTGSNEPITIPHVNYSAFPLCFCFFFSKELLLLPSVY